MNLALFPPVEKFCLDCYLVSMTILGITLLRRSEKLVAKFLRDSYFGVEDMRRCIVSRPILEACRKKASVRRRANNVTGCL